MHCIAARYGSILYVRENLLVHLCLSCEDGVHGSGSPLSTSCLDKLTMSFTPPGRDAVA
jgi:hypothetical protein